MSGSLWAGWANSQSVVGASNRLLQQLDCTASKKGGSENSKQLLSCLKKLPAEAIERASDNLVLVRFLKKIKNSCFRKFVAFWNFAGTKRTGLIVNGNLLLQVETLHGNLGKISDRHCTK